MSRTSLLVLAATAALGGAAPALAQAAVEQAPVAQAPAAPPARLADSAVEGFYAAHSNALIWLKDDASREAAQKLAAVLRRATVDGLADGPNLAADVESALVQGGLEADKLISSAWVRYVQALRRPVDGVSYGDPALAPKMPTAQAVLGEAAQAPSLAAHLDQVAAVNPLYSALREQAIAGGSGDDPRVQATLSRLRIIPAKGRAVVVDVASAQLWMLEDGRAVDSMKVVIGKKASPTPLLAGTIHYVTLNPYWNIPADVARKNVAPLVLKRGVSYLKAARYVTADGFGKAAQLVDATAIDWKAVAAGEAPVHIRQLPGGNNMMGAMKFGFVNDYDIFLHDTPRRDLFAKEKRTYSLGCIRLEHADRLKRWLLGRDAQPVGEAPEQHVEIDKGVPVYVTSLTAKVEDGALAFAEDVYGFDRLPETAEPLTTASLTSAQ